MEFHTDRVVEFIHNNYMEDGLKQEEMDKLLNLGVGYKQGLEIGRVWGRREGQEEREHLIASLNQMKALLEQKYIPFWKRLTFIIQLGVYTKKPSLR